MGHGAISPSLMVLFDPELLSLYTLQRPTCILYSGQSPPTFCGPDVSHPSSVKRTEYPPLRPLKMSPTTFTERQSPAAGTRCEIHQDKSFI